MQKSRRYGVYALCRARKPGWDMEGYNVENAAVNADPWLNAIVDDLQPYAAQYPGVGEVGVLFHEDPGACQAGKSG